MRSGSSIFRGIKYRGGAPSNPKKLGNTPITRGIVGCWPSWSELGKDGVADGSGQLYDISGFGSHATLQGIGNEPGYDVSANTVLKTELKLPAVIDYDLDVDAKFPTTVIAPPHLLITGDLTVSFWIELQALGGVGGDAAICFGTTGETPETNILYSIFVSPISFDYFHEFGSGTNVAFVGSTLPLIGTAYHFVFVRRGVSVRAWLNGAEEINSSFASNQFPTGGTIGKLGIGGIPDVNNRNFAGGLAFLTIWNRALTESDALSLFHRGTRWQMFETVPNIAASPADLLSIDQIASPERQHRQFISNVGRGMG